MLYFKISASMLRAWHCFIISPVVAHEKAVVILVNKTQAIKPAQRHGRAGLGLITHIAPRGYCTSPVGVHFAISDTFAGWGSAESACPADTWVCSSSDLSSNASCDIPTATSVQYRECDGTVPISSTYDYLNGWISDRGTPLAGFARSSNNLA